MGLKYGLSHFSGLSIKTLLITGACAQAGQGAGQGAPLRQGLHPTHAVLGAIFDFSIQPLTPQPADRGARAASWPLCTSTAQYDSSVSVTETWCHTPQGGKGGKLAALYKKGAVRVSSLTGDAYTLHPTPYTLHPTPYTLHPTPYTLHP